VQDVTPVATIARSLALVKVVAEEESRHRLMEIVRVFRARVVDLAPRTLIIEITGAEDKIEALVEVLRPFGIIEMVRTGQVVMTRGLQRGKQNVTSEPKQDPQHAQKQRSEPEKDHANSVVQETEASHSV